MPRDEVAAQYRRHGATMQSLRSVRSRQGFARVVADTLDHGAQAVGALRGQVFAESEFVEHRDRVGRQNFLRGAAGIKRQQDRDQAADIQTLLAPWLK